MRPACPALLPALLLATAGCSPKGDVVESVREVGTVPDPPGATGRDTGFSISWGGHSVWVFGDTFFAKTAQDGYHWRSSTWSYTDDRDASDGLGGWVHALSKDGDPLQLLPHTAAEQAFDDQHNGTPCPAGTDCGARHTPWPGAVVADPQRGALVFYTNEVTEPTSAFSFHATGTSIATWASPEGPAVRPTVRPDLPDPTVLFPVEEPPWGAAALVADGLLYAYACPGGGLSAPCRIARVPLPEALDRSAWRFWEGTGWVPDWHPAVAVFDGAPQMSVHFSEYLGKYLAIYMVPLGQQMALRTADQQEGPWSSEQPFGTGATPGSNWDYALLAHHELARSGGRVEYLSYYQPGTFLDGTIHLVELSFR